MSMFVIINIDSAKKKQEALYRQVLFQIFMNFCDYATSRKTHPIWRKLR